VVGICRLTLTLARGQLDHHRLERPTGSPVDRHDRSGARRGETDTVRLPILEEELTTLDPIAHSDVHPWLHERIIASDNRDLTYGRRPVYLLLGLAGYGKVETLPDEVNCHTVSFFSPLRPTAANGRREDSKTLSAWEPEVGDQSRSMVLS
jgi:hypothetical protein